MVCATVSTSFRFGIQFLAFQGLFSFYHDYIIVAFSTAKIVQFLIPYMLIMGTFERYTWIVNRKFVFLLSNQQLAALLIAIVMIFRGP